MIKAPSRCPSVKNREALEEKLTFCDSSEVAWKATELLASGFGIQCRTMTENIGIKCTNKWWILSRDILVYVATGDLRGHCGRLGVNSRGLLIDVFVPTKRHLTV